MAVKKKSTTSRKNQNPALYKLSTEELESLNKSTSSLHCSVDVSLRESGISPGPMELLCTDLCSRSQGGQAGGCHLALLAAYLPLQVGHGEAF